ncbi:MAG: hypothetical protein FJ125_10715, partial [Deltaproteobacteria bacterium]|nr:hypothetical protein [Deltaproteobacteria bacterium]
VRSRYREFESAYTGVDTRVLTYQIPGGMISNLASQLKEQGALERMEEVLAEVPRVRADLGYPPLVTPTSQIVGSQAVINVLVGDRYKVVTRETREYLLGNYGRSPVPVDEQVLRKAVGDARRITVRPADLLEPELERLKAEAGPLVQSEEDLLSCVLFPGPAAEYFAYRQQGGPAAEAAQAAAAAAAWLLLEERRHAALPPAAAPTTPATAGGQRPGVAWRLAGRWEQMGGKPAVR